MLSMSFGLMKLSGLRPAESPPPEPVPTGTPSRTISGSLPAVTEVGPRTRMATPPPGSLLSDTWTPGTLARISSSGLTTRPVLKSAADTWVTAPVMLPARCSPYPVTTISARFTARAVSTRSTSIVCPRATVTDRPAGRYPMSLARSESVPAGTPVMTNWPSGPVCALRVPNDTVAPAMGGPAAASVTFPRIVPD